MARDQVASVETDVERKILNSRKPYKTGIICIIRRTCSPRNPGETLDVVSARRRITMIYQRLAKVFLICSDVPAVPALSRDPWRRDRGRSSDERGHLLGLHSRQPQKRNALYRRHQQPAGKA